MKKIIEFIRWAKFSRIAAQYLQHLPKSEGITVVEWFNLPNAKGIRILVTYPGHATPNASTQVIGARWVSVMCDVSRKQTVDDTRLRIIRSVTHAQRQIMCRLSGYTV